MKYEQSLGYWLVDAEEAVTGDREARYRGIDRQPRIPGPDEDDRLHSEGRDNVLQIRDRYWQSDDTGDLHAKAGLAIELRDLFAAEGIVVEVVLAEIVEIPELGHIPSDLRALFERNLAHWRTTTSNGSGAEIVPLGIDVTYPFPSFHSAIRQPVLSIAAPDSLRALNKAGLFSFSDLDLARDVVARCNEQETSWRPFCAVAVSSVDGE